LFTSYRRLTLVFPQFFTLREVTNHIKIQSIKYQTDHLTFALILLRNECFHREPCQQFCITKHKFQNSKDQPLHHNSANTSVTRHQDSTSKVHVSSTMSQQQYHLLHQIESNSLPILELTKEIEEIFDENLRYDDITLLVKALSKNESINYVRFEGDFLDCLHPFQRSELLQAVGSYLPSLQHLGLGDSPILVSDLCHMVVRSRSLKSLQLHDSILQGTSQDFDILEEALRSHGSIQELEIHECTSTIPGTNLKTLRTARTRRSPATVMRSTQSPLHTYGKRVLFSKPSDIETMKTSEEISIH